MKKNRCIKTAAKFLIAAVICLQTAQQSRGENQYESGFSATDIFNRDWYADQGVTLPRQFGIGFNLIYMDRDIAVTDVSVKIGGLPPESVSDLANFDVENTTTLSMMRLDAWVLPFLDVYLMLGETRTDTSLYVTFEPPDGGAEETIVENTKVSGPLLGAGATLVYGGDAWFVMADANFSNSDIEGFDDPIDAWYLSSRIGWHTTHQSIQYRAWTGLAYLDSKRTISATVDRPLLDINVRVDQEPVNPWNAAVGGSISINQRWEILSELGSNFSDATVVVFSVSGRFF